MHWTKLPIVGFALFASTSIASAQTISTKRLCDGAHLSQRYVLSHKSEFTKEHIRWLAKYTREVCGGGAKARAWRDTALKNWLEAQQQREAAQAVGSFLLGFATGFAGSYSPPVHNAPRTYTPNRTAPRIASRPTTTIRTAPRVVSRPTNTTRPTNPTSPTSTRASPARTATQTRATPSVSSGGGVVGHIRQPNGKLDAVYSKPPCATTAQTGPTSYNCTNQ
jgi:hypothetical protein